MAKRKGPDKFHVGQRVVFVATASCGWRPLNGAFGVVTRGREFYTGPTYDMAGNRTGCGSGLIYRVQIGDHNIGGVEEYFRAIYDGEEPLTWEKFAKVTGLDLATVSAASKAARRKRKASAPLEPHHG